MLNFLITLAGVSNYVTITEIDIMTSLWNNNKDIGSIADVDMFRSSTSHSWNTYYESSTRYSIRITEVKILNLSPISINSTYHLFFLYRNNK
jgi:hypothetical protein